MRKPIVETKLVKTKATGITLPTIDGKAPYVKKITLKPSTEIFEYIRRRRSGKVHKVGIIFGTEIKGVIKVGWSKCNFKAGDKFDTKVGLTIAFTRAIKQSDIHTPNCIRRQVRQFGARCVRYFQNANKLELPV